MEAGLAKDKAELEPSVETPLQVSTLEEDNSSANETTSGESVPVQTPTHEQTSDPTMPKRALDMECVLARERERMFTTQLRVC